MKLKNENIGLAIRDLFAVLFCLFCLFSFMELLKPRLVMNYIDLNLFLLVLILLGGFSVYFHSLEPRKNKFDFYSHSVSLLLAVFLGLFSFYLAKEVGWLAVLIGLASAIISYSIIILLYKGR